MNGGQPLFSDGGTIRTELVSRNSLRGEALLLEEPA